MIDNIRVTGYPKLYCTISHVKSKIETRGSMDAIVFVSDYLCICLNVLGLVLLPHFQQHGASNMNRMNLVSESYISCMRFMS